MAKLTIDNLKKGKYRLCNLKRRIIRATKRFDGCMKCGTDGTDHRRLTYHHLQKDAKKFNLSMECLTLPLEEIFEEMCKCIVLCERCHKRIEGEVG